MRYNYQEQPQEFDDQLSHYGILGMKWGVRRTPEELGYKTAAHHKKSGGASLQKVAAAQKKPTRKEQKAAIKAAQEEAKRQEQERIRQMTHDQVMKSSSAKEIQAHKAELTNQELQERLNRLNLEQQLQAYVNAQNPSPAQKQKYFNGKQMVGNALQQAGTEVLKSASSYAFKQAFKLVLSEDAYKEMFANNDQKKKK